MVKKTIKLSKKEFLDCVKIAKEHLKSAKILLKEGQYRDSISRSYYAYFDIVSSLLATKGMITKTHSGALQLFSLHFLKTKLLPKKTSQLMAKLMEKRQKADYSWSEKFSKKDAVDALTIAEDFLKLVESKTNEIL